MFFIFHGDDAFSEDEEVARLKAQLGDSASVALNTAVFDGHASLTLGDLRAACDTVPFLAEHRLVIVEGLLTRLLGREEDEGEGEGGAPQAVARGRARAGGPARELLDQLADYLLRLPETTYLVFVERRELPPKHPLLKLATGKVGAARHFGLPEAEALADWILQRAHRHGSAFTPGAARLLAQYIGPELHALDQEIGKLITYVGGARSITPEDVQALVPAAGQANIFAMVDALGRRDGRQATRLLHGLLDQGEHPLGLLAMIVRQFRMLLLVKEFGDSGVPQVEIARRLGVPGFVGEKLTRQARQFTVPQLEEIYRRLLDTDVAVKTGETDADVALDVFVAGMA